MEYRDEHVSDRENSEEDADKADKKDKDDKKDKKAQVPIFPLQTAPPVPEADDDGDESDNGDPVGLEGAAFQSRLPYDKMVAVECAAFPGIGNGSPQTQKVFLYIRNRIVS